MLTKVQKKRLAREARKLAFECLTNGPEITDFWPSCAIGESLRRADIYRDDTCLRADESMRQEAGFSGLPFGELSRGVLSTATRMRARNEERTAVVFPLLAWADFLEESSEQPPAGPSNDF